MRSVAGSNPRAFDNAGGMAVGLSPTDRVVILIRGAVNVKPFPRESERRLGDAPGTAPRGVVGGAGGFLALSHRLAV